MAPRDDDLEATFNQHRRKCIFAYDDSLCPSSTLTVLKSLAYLFVDSKWSSADVDRFAQVQDQKETDAINEEMGDRLDAALRRGDADGQRYRCLVSGNDEDCPEDTSYVERSLNHLVSDGLLWRKDAERIRDESQKEE